MKMQDLIGLTYTEVRNRLDNAFTKEIADIYSEALAAKDTIIAVAAQDELCKRGDIEVIGECFTEACYAAKIEFGTSFCNTIVEGFVGMDGLDFILSKIVKHIKLAGLLGDVTSIDGIERTAKENFAIHGLDYTDFEPMFHNWDNNNQNTQ